MAEIAPQNARKAATPATAAVVPAQLTILPMQIERVNCARNTIELTIATSVPRPRTWLVRMLPPPASVSNCNSYIYMGGRDSSRQCKENCGLNLLLCMVKTNFLSFPVMKNRFKPQLNI